MAPWRRHQANGVRVTSLHFRVLSLPVPWLGFGKLYIPHKSPTIYSILLFSHDIEPIILSKVAHYSRIILNSEIIVYSKLMWCIQTRCNYMILWSFLSDSRLVSVIVLGNCNSVIELCTCTHMHVSYIVMRSPLTRSSAALLALVLPYAVMICPQRRCHIAGLWYI